MLLWGVRSAALNPSAEDNMNKNASATRTLSGYLGIAFATVAVLLFVGLILARIFVYEPFRVSSDSMYPTIQKGSFLLIDKRAGSLRKTKSAPNASIARGDIVAYLMNDSVYAHRVIGLPGEHIALKGRELTINHGAVPVHVELGAHAQVERFEFQLVTETIEDHRATIAWITARPSLDLDATVPEGHFFVLGDNRDNARDSRFTGPVPKEKIVGKVVWVSRF